MNSKVKKIVVWNLIIISVILIIAEIWAYYYHNEKQLYGAYNNSYIPYFYSTRDLLKIIPDGAYYPLRYSEPDKTFKSNKKPILLLGCSYTFGNKLSEEESFAGQLKKYSNRWVYNYGIVGQDLAVASMLMDEEKINPNIKQEPEYIIYTYMFHHMHRISNWRHFNYYRQKGYIPDQKYNFLYRSYLYSYFQNRILHNKLLKDNKFKLHKQIFFEMFKDLKKTTEEIYPNSKLVVIIYSDVNQDINNFIKNQLQFNNVKINNMFKILDSDDFKKKFEELGVTVFTTEDLIGRKMNLEKDRIPNDPDTPHPSASAWAEIAPKLTERLKL